MKHDGKHKNGKARPVHEDKSQQAWHHSEATRSEYERKREERDRRDARALKDRVRYI